MPHWTSGAKDGVGTAPGARSRVWFTLADGILTEVYYPRVDQANTRDLRLVLTGEDGFVADERRDTHHEIAPLAAGVPGYRVVNRCARGTFELHKTVIAHVAHPAVLQLVRVDRPEAGASAGLRLFALLSPHVGNHGADNDGWLDHYHGVPMLYARRGARTLALACSAPLRAATCTYAGPGDAWHDLRAHGMLTAERPHAFGGNLLLACEVDLDTCDGRFVLVLAFGTRQEEAGQHARAALLDDADACVRRYVDDWRAFHGGHLALGDDAAGAEAYRVSMAMLHAHEDKESSGALIASLAVPWGEARGDHQSAGYHLVWARDLVECAGALLAAGRPATARNVLLYLMSTQEADGRWPQNMWLDGEAYWSGIQLDETALPVLLADALRRHDALDGVDPWPMVRRAAGYLLRNGPATPQDRWEEEGGYSPYTLAAEIAALLAAADFADLAGEDVAARYLRETADYWNGCVERWTYVRDTDVALRVGVPGYYVRLAPRATASGVRSRGSDRDAPSDGASARYRAVVSPDALALVRFGLRRPDDPRILDTVRVIDETLATDTPAGPVWHRFTGDDYGEHDDGTPFDGTGVGRGWPLLAGERAHYELAAGDAAAARRLGRVMLAQAGAAGLFPEQVWDAADIPARGLRCGRPTGSAMPLAWAHAEYVKLCRSLRDGRVFDMPPQPAARYLDAEHPSPLVVWRHDAARRAMPAGHTLRIQLGGPGRVRWAVGRDGECGEPVDATPTGLGVAHVDLPTTALPPGSLVRFAVSGPHGPGSRGRDAAVAAEHVVTVTGRDERPR